MKTILLSLFLICFLGLAIGQKDQLIAEAGKIKVETLAENLTHPWGMAVLPEGDLLVTERAGYLRRFSKGKMSEPLGGLPEIWAKGQGGLLDVVLDPDFANNQLVYFSYAEPGEDGTASTAVGRGKLNGNQLDDFQKIFTMLPKVKGPNHFGSRLVFDGENHLFITTGERFKFDPAQDLSTHMGKVLRIHKDGSVPEDNPFVGQGDAEGEIYSLGHRNIQAAAIEPSTGRLWVVEMGPMGGDELNLIKKGANYGWPLVSWGKDYDGTDRPDPPTRPEFADAAIHWTPTISPSGMLFYDGEMFAEYRGSAMIGGLTASGIVRVVIDGEKAREVERLPLAYRTRDVEQAPDGSIYVLTDYRDGKLLRLVAYGEE